jgi:hypothetical protein
VTAQSLETLLAAEKKNVYIYTLVTEKAGKEPKIQKG